MAKHTANGGPTPRRAARPGKAAKAAKPEPGPPGPDDGRLRRTLIWNKRRRWRKKRRIARMSRPKRVFRKLGIIGTWCLAMVTVLAVTTVILFYKLTDVPSPASLPLPQVAIIEYSNGHVMARVGTQNRTSVPLQQVPVQVRWDVLSAEDRNFYNEPGISIRGTARALVSDLTGGDTQGGSGITQQYVKNAYLNDSRTLTRKVKELMIAVKLSREYSKDQILEWYLNTVYFGRGAYGIEAAAEAYFGENVSRLDAAQGAVLAALLRAPSYYDPAVHPGEAKARWNYVIQGMVSVHRLTQAQASALRYPKVRKPQSNQLGATGPTELIVQQVINELSQDGINDTELHNRGLIVRTSINQRAQHDAVAAIKQAYAHPSRKQRNIRKALVAVQPKTGGVLAYYGGSDGSGLDYAQAWRQPGSTFKPYVLATALTQTLQGAKKQYTINSVFNGASPQEVDGFEIHNDPSDPTSGHFTLRQAMTLSLNTVFYRLASLVGPANVANLAHAAGIPMKQTGTGPEPGAKTLQDPNGNVGDKIGIGGYEVRPIDQAVGYATLADGGVEHNAWFVQKVTDSNGNLVYKHKVTGSQVIAKQVVNDTTLAMEQVASSSGIAPSGGRQVAAKTGTVGIASSANSSDAWTAGFTPQVAVASWAGSNTLAPIYDDAGTSMYGRQNPGQAWQLFLDAFLNGKPDLPLPVTQEIKAAGQTSSSPPPSSTVSSTPPSSTVPSPTASSSTAPSTPPPTSASSTPTTPPPSPSSGTSSCGPIVVGCSP